MTVCGRAAGSHIHWFSQPLSLAVMLAGALLSACSSGGGDGGGNGGDSANVTISGTVQKGLFKKLQVKAIQIDPITAKSGPVVLATVTGQDFELVVAKEQLIKIEATGEFVNDVTGETVLLNEPLLGLVQTGVVNEVVNINIATTLAAIISLENLTTSGLSPSELIAQQADYINQVLGFSPSTDLQKLDFKNIGPESTIADPNLQLLMLSGGLTESLANNTEFFAGGFNNIVDGILAAENLLEAQGVMTQLNGLPAKTMYDQVKQNSGYTLPLNPLKIEPFLNCSNGCTWEEPDPNSVSVAGMTVWEADGQATITLRVGRFPVEPIQITVRTESDTARTGEDFAGINRTITIPENQRTVTLGTLIFIDALPEPGERFKITIESATPSHPVHGGTAYVVIKDGYPASLNGQDATGMAIQRVAMPTVCGPAGDNDGLDCAPITGQTLGVVDGQSTIGLTEIDLAAECSSAVDCSQQEMDWLAEFFLVARNSLNVQQGEVPLGPYIYKKDSVQLVGDDQKFRYPALRLTSEAVLALARNATSSGWDLELQARVGEQTLVRDLPGITPVPSTVLVGETLLDIGLVNDIQPGGAGNGCAASQFALNANYSQDISVFLSVAEADLPMGSGILCVDFDPLNTSGATAVMIEGSLDAIGGSAPPESLVFYPLPVGAISWLTIDVDEAAIGVPAGLLGDGSAGVPYLLIVPDNPAATVTNELHVEGWPFLLTFERITLTPAGIEFGYSNARHVMAVDYSASDPRGNGRLYSNDIYYRGIKGQSGGIILGPNGISGEITVAGGAANAAYTAFPKAWVEWQEFTQAIENTKLQALQIGITAFLMEQSTSCSGPDCLAGQSDFYSVKSASAALDGNGFVLGNAINQGPANVPGFGRRAGGAMAWSRPDDLTGQSNLKLAIPGYVLPDQKPAANYLLAHLNESSSAGEIDVYPIGTAANRDGNYHPVGLSIGPEIYRDSLTGLLDVGNDGIDTSAFGGRLAVNNGFDPSFELQSSEAVKYVLRNAGMTGVFNVASGVLGTSAPQFYGYTLDLERFAVRATDNELDEYTWIDGRLALQREAGGPGGLDIFFTNMQIDCSARLGGINLLYEACDGIDNNDNDYKDENCSPTLHAWQADTDIFAAGFKGPSSAAVCSVDRQDFWMEQQLHFAALNKPVAVETSWNPDGTLASEVASQLPTYRFDKSAEGDGFPLNTTAAHLRAGQLDNGDDYGWLEFEESRVGVPFWNSLQTDVRVANQRRGNDLIAEPTVVLPLAKLDPESAATLRNKTIIQSVNERGADLKLHRDLNIDAIYEWGGTGFNFTLPVYYQPWQLDAGRNDADANGRQSRFVGRQLSKDLFVMDANAGINFIEPDRTKLSFGASADFEKLGNLQFQIDITDPDSARVVDDLLQSLKITNSPLLEPALSGLLEGTEVVNRYATRGMDELLQTALERALKEIGEASAALTPNNQDPFVTISGGLTQLRSMPQQILANVTTELRQPLDNELFARENQLRNELAQLEVLLTDLPANPLDDDYNAAMAKFDQVMGTIKDVLDSVEEVEGRMEDALTTAQSLKNQADELINDLVQATYDVQLVMNQTVSVSNAICSDNFVSDPEGNGFLNGAAERFHTVRQIADVIRNSNQIFAAAETLAKDEDTKRRLATSKRRVQEATGELLGYLDDADQAIRSVACHPEELAQITAKANEYITDLQADLVLVQLRLNQATQPLQQLSGLTQTLADEVRKPMEDVYWALDRSRIEIDDYVKPGLADGAAVLRGIDCALLEVSSAKQCTNSSKPAVTDGLEINALVASESGERDVIDLVFDPVKNRIDDVFKAADTAVADITRGLLPGAYFTPEQLRRLVVTEIMRSQPVEDLRLAMDKHFGEIGSKVNDIVLQFTDQINEVIMAALASVTGPINDALKESLSVVREMPLQAAEVNGFATIAGNELERAHISAGWTMRGSDDDDSTTFKAALDAESWSVRQLDPDLKTPTACAVKDGESLLDVKISAYGLPIKVMAANIDIEKLYLGFTLQSNKGRTPALLPIGVFGGINTIGEIGFTDAIVFDPGFAAAVGTKQTYVGARAGASFSGLTAEVAFLVGRVCPGNDVIADLDPDAVKFLPSLPPSGFTGAYVRGGATIPIIPGGCALNVGITSDFGYWIFIGQPTNIGGLVGGGAVGQVACVASIKGQVRVGGNVSTDGDIKLTGEAWGVAGAGFDCDPGTWTSVRRSREDSWCGTADAQFNASFDNGKWDISPPKVDLLF